MTETKTLNDLGSNAGLERATKLRADLDYIRAYLEEAHREFVMHEILINPTGLLMDVTEFIARDNDERSNASHEGPEAAG